MDNLQKIIKDLQEEKYLAKAAVEQFRNKNDEYAGFYKGKVEVYSSCIEKLNAILNCNTQKIN